MKDVTATNREETAQSEHKHRRNREQQEIQKNNAQKANSTENSNWGALLPTPKRYHNKKHKQ